VAQRGKKSGGRVTPKGTRPESRRRGEYKGGLEDELHHDPTHMHGTHEVGASTRYTPPVPGHQKHSPPWVPVLMFVLMGLGALIILLYYLGAVPGGRDNWYLFVGLITLLGGLYTATRYH
jgi:hypothetical protein